MTNSAFQGGEQMLKTHSALAIHFYEVAFPQIR